MKKTILALLLTLAVPVAIVSAAVTSTESRRDTTGNGVTTAFTFTFPVTTSASHVEVFLAGVKQTTGYTVALNANQTSSPGGSVTFAAAPGSGVVVRIQRTVPLKQETVYTPYSAFPAKTTERALDQAAFQAQQIDRRVADAESSIAAVGSNVAGFASSAPASPSCAPAPGTYRGAQSVVLISATPGSAIYYTVDGSVPTIGSTPYTGGLAVPSSRTIKAIAVVGGFLTSAVTSCGYSIEAPTAPTFSPPAGYYTTPQSVTLSTAVAGAQIRYTLDGSTPTASSSLYGSPLSISGTTTVRAVAMADGFSSSASSATYWFDETMVVRFSTPGCFASGSAAGEVGEQITFARSSLAEGLIGGATSSCPSNQVRVLDAPRGALIEPQRTQYFVAPDAPATQTIAGLSASAYFGWIEGTGSIDLALTGGSATGLPCTITGKSSCAFTVTAGPATVTATASGTVTFAQVENGTFGTSKIHAAATTREADVASVASPIASNTWCITATITPGEWAPLGFGRGGLWQIGTWQAANSASLWLDGSNLLFGVWDSGGLQRYVGGASANVFGQGRTGTAFVNGHATRVMACNNAGTLTLWTGANTLNDTITRVGNGTQTGSGTGLQTAWGSTLHLGRVPGLNVANAQPESGATVGDVRVCRTATSLNQATIDLATARPPCWPVDEERVLVAADSILSHWFFQDTFGPMAGKAWLVDDMGYGGDMTGTGFLAFPDGLSQWSASVGSWISATPGVPASAYSAVVLMYGANDSETSAFYERAYEKLYAQARKYVPTVILGTPPRKVLVGLNGWESPDSYSTAGKVTAWNNILAKWTPRAMNLYSRFTGLVDGGSYSWANLYRDQVHQSYGLGMRESTIAATIAHARQGTETVASPAIDGSVLTYLWGQPTVGAWTQTLTTVTPGEHEFESQRLFGVAPQANVASSSGAKVVFPPAKFTQIWVHFLQTTATGSMVVYIDRGTGSQVSASITTGSGTINNYLQSRPVADALSTSSTHTVEIETTSGNPVKVVGVTYVGVP